MISGGSRYRVVTFRISSEEYENMCAASRSDGSRSVSDFARLAVADRVRLVNERFSLEDQINEITSKWAGLEPVIQDITTRLERLEGVVKPPETQ
jgi:hypothetical protein